MKRGLLVLCLASIVSGTLGPVCILGTMLHDAYVGAQDLVCLTVYEEKHGLERGGFHGDIGECHLHEVKKLGYHSTRVWLEMHNAPALLFSDFEINGQTFAEAWFRRGMFLAIALALQAIIVSGVSAGRCVRRRKYDES